MGPTATISTAGAAALPLSRVPVLVQKYTRERWVSVLFLLPSVVFLLLTSVYPLLYSLRLSFYSWNMSIPFSQPVFIGL